MAEFRLTKMVKDQLGKQGRQTSIDKLSYVFWRKYREHVLKLLDEMPIKNNINNPANKFALIFFQKEFN